MRFGLADARNYDSVELTRSLDWFEPLYEPTDEARSSRRTVSWPTVAEALPRLREAAVGAVVAASPPPDPSLFSRVERVGEAWVAWLDGADPVAFEGPGRATASPRNRPGAIRVEVDAEGPGRVVVRATWDDGWRASVDGIPVKVGKHIDMFMSVTADSHSRIVELEYAPTPFRAAAFASAGATAAAVLALTWGAVLRIDGMARWGLGRTRARRLRSSQNDLGRGRRPARRY
jgi:hypothetical protein